VRSPGIVTATLAAALLAASSAVSSETARDPGASPEKPLVTDRPTNSASPELVPAHALQLELGYVFTRLDTDPGRT